MTDESAADRRTFLAALAGATTAGLAGCGGSADSSGTGDRPGSAETATGAETTDGAATERGTPPASSLDPVELAPFWTTGEKYGFATAADHGSDDPSRVWVTLTKGALTEPRFPRVDLMHLRRVDFLVTDGEDYHVRTHRRRRDGDDGVARSVVPAADDALLYRHEFSGTDREWSLTAEYAVDPAGDGIVADVSVDAPEDLTVYLVARPAVAGATAGGRGVRLPDGDGYALAAAEADPSGVVADRAGEGYPTAVAVAADGGFEWATVGDVDDATAKGLLARGATVEPGAEAAGNLVLGGKLGEGTTETTVALGFVEGADPEAALSEARRALDRGYETVRRAYRETWRAATADIDAPDSVSGDDELRAQYRTAVMTLYGVEDKTFAGAGIASPSVPWGNGVVADTPRDVGYNFVWSRDLYQSFTALLAAGDRERARAATEYLLTVQQRTGGFLPQNTYLDGRTRWGGEQMDNVAFPVVMAYQLRERAGVGFEDAAYGYEDVRLAAEYVARNGPATQQERWEEEAGYSPSSIAAEIAGLACGAALADAEGEREDALIWLALADAWRAGVPEWTATTTGADGHEPPYYLRVSDDGDPDDGATRGLANGGPPLDERAIVDAGFLELVRLGVSPAGDDLIRNSVAIVDESIRVDTPHGPGFYRYVGDGYGEGEDGGPWSTAPNTVGRLWPILTGERAEYELRAGTESGPLAPANLLRTMAGFANEGRMIPEQVWDRENPTEYGWEFGEGTGSATPLSWSMAQFVRLAHGVDAGEPVETPAFVRDRYSVDGGPPAPPSLDVTFPDAVVDTKDVAVSGTTDAAEVFVRTPAETVRVSGGGSFEATVRLEPGRNAVAVVAATAEDALVDARLAAARTELSYSA